MNSTGWGWIAIASVLAVLALLVWRPGREKVAFRLAKVFILVLLIPCFIFSLMQWVSWYNPTGWGWMTIVSVLTMVALFVWHPKQENRALTFIRTVTLVLLIPCLLFSFMQWASWYK